MSALLEVNNISKSYQLPSRLLGTTTECILSEISFELESGKILAVVGESGSGKSTLARQVVTLEQPDSGEMLLDGKPYISIPDIHQRVRMIFQNPIASLNPRKRVYQLLEQPLKNLRNLSSSERRELIFQCLEHVGLDKDQAQRYPHMLSGGQRQRIAIARAIILSPQVIVADEAVSALDVSVQAQILNLIMDLRDDMGMSWLFITHDISVVKVIADTVMVLYAGRVMEMGPVKQVLESPLHPYTRKLLQSVPCVDCAGNDVVAVDVKSASYDKAPIGPACAYLARCPIADKHCAECLPPMMNFNKHLVSCLKAVEST